MTVAAVLRNMTMTCVTNQVNNHNIAPWQGQSGPARPQKLAAEPAFPRTWKQAW